MVDLQNKVAGFSIRLWVLVANLLGNILMVYGAVHYVARGAHAAEMIIGVTVTAGCVAVLAIPDRRP